MRQLTNAPIFKLGQTLSRVVFLILFLMLAFPVRAAVTNEPVDFGPLSYDSVINEVMKNQCPFNDEQSYIAYYNSCSSQNNCLQATEWFRTDDGFMPVEGIIVSNGASNKFYPRTCYEANFQNSSVAVPATPTVEGASIETQEVKAVTGANDISFSVTAATVAGGFSLVILYFVLANQNWFTKLRLEGYSRYARFMKR